MEGNKRCRGKEEKLLDGDILVSEGEQEREGKKAWKDRKKQTNKKSSLSKLCRWDYYRRHLPAVKPEK